MRRYNDLNKKEKEKAFQKALASLLEAVVTGTISFNDALNHDDLQARIDRAIEKAEQMQTPWFAHEYIMDDEHAKNELEAMARVDAEDAYYPEAGEIVFLI